jgi:hypothetical protein
MTSTSKRRERVSDASRLLDYYLRMTQQPRSPGDPMQQAQLAMLEQWIRHLEFVLYDEKIPADVVRRIIKSFIYGCKPNAGETGLRENIMGQYVKHLQSCTPDSSWLSEQLKLSRRSRRTDEFPDFGPDFGAAGA